MTPRILPVLLCVIFLSCKKTGSVEELTTDRPATAYRIIASTGDTLEKFIFYYDVQDRLTRVNYKRNHGSPGVSNHVFDYYYSGSSTKADRWEADYQYPAISEKRITHYQFTGGRKVYDSTVIIQNPTGAQVQFFSFAADSVYYFGKFSGHTVSDTIFQNWQNEKLLLQKGKATYRYSNGGFIVERDITTTYLNQLNPFYKLAIPILQETIVENSIDSRINAPKYLIAQRQIRYHKYGGGYNDQINTIYDYSYQLNSQGLPTTITEKITSSDPANPGATFFLHVYYK